ncbi:MAG: YciI family protein [Acidobacteriota bacterium]
MKYFVALLKMKDTEKNAAFRPQHIDFLTGKEEEGVIFARGRFANGEGGLVIYMAESLNDALKLAQSDPYVAQGARTLELFEWNMKLNEVRAGSASCGYY